MKFYKEYILKNGNNLIVRNAEIDDAESYAKTVNVAHTETKFLGYSTVEKSYSAEEEISYIQKIQFF